MGWTHDDREKAGGTSLAPREDTARPRRSTGGRSTGAQSAAGRDGLNGIDPRLGIPLILRRRARWVSARLRHPRG
ncbi:hypothetical protein [Streptomyces meridianus]|uniref:Uncharacterized protein n=1 Tax=Streptomyces meridianus TaxID=2938945 RepID=A0ABT0X621_9ACTN|nr:hypothetical protein [Streptomyces meridianus]MCM2577715.1 hypothetical protein [Streptomyces meridianus]